MMHYGLNKHRSFSTYTVKGHSTGLHGCTLYASRDALHVPLSMGSAPATSKRQQCLNCPYKKAQEQQIKHEGTAISMGFVLFFICVFVYIYQFLTVILK